MSRFHRFDQEYALANQLYRYGCNLFDGTTDTLIRRERARSAILENDLATDFAERFRSIYGQPIHPQSNINAHVGEVAC